MDRRRRRTSGVEPKEAVQSRERVRAPKQEENTLDSLNQTEPSKIQIVARPEALQ